VTSKNRNALLWLLFVFGLFFLGLAALFIQRSEGYAMREAEKQAFNVLLTQRAVHGYVSDVQRREIYRLQDEKQLAKEYFSPQLMSRTYIARQIMQRLNGERQLLGLEPIYFKLASNNPRNPINQADAYESDVLQRFNAGQDSEFREVVTYQASKWLYLAVPVQANSASCLKCHGQPEDAPADLLRQYGDKAGFFEKLGDKRALISIRVPMAGILAQGRDHARTLILNTFLGLAAVYLLIFGFMRRLDAKHEIILEQNRELGRLSVTDPLTGLFNRSGFLNVLEIRMREAIRYGTPLALAMLDIDHFKIINDRHGHAVGDAVLKLFSEVLRRNVRGADVVCRWGGEEFLVLLPQQDEVGAVASAENLRRALEVTSFAPVEALSASFGVAEYLAGDDLQGWIARADQALYAAKAAGRNTVRSAHSASGGQTDAAGQPHA
jgi:two-component system, cell cycle response regulator